MNDQPNLPPNYFYHRLSNGIEMVGQYMPSLSSITFGFQLDAAVIHEPEEKKGLAHLFEYMLFQGTKQKDARALNEAFESLGARKGASTGLESSQVWAQIVNTRAVTNSGQRMCRMGLRCPNEERNGFSGR